MRLQKMRYDPVQLAEEMTEMLSLAQERDPNASLESLRKRIEERETLKRERLVAATRKLRETVGSLAKTLAEIDGAIDGGDVDAIKGRLVQINRHLRAIPDSITPYEGFSGSMPL